LVGRDAGQTEFDMLGETGGAKTHALTTAELASHTHGSGTLAGTTNSAGGHQHNISVVNNTGGSAGDHFAAQNGAYNDTNTDGVATDGAHTHTVAVNSGATASARSSTAHNNLQPYLVVNYIIKTQCRAGERRVSPSRWSVSTRSSRDLAFYDACLAHSVPCVAPSRCELRAIPRRREPRSRAATSHRTRQGFPPQ
jgi:microcystin-dependent protein